MDRHPLGRHPAELLTQPASPPRPHLRHIPAQSTSACQQPPGDPSFSDGELLSWNLHNVGQRIPRKKGVIDPAVADIPTITDKIDMIQENFVKRPDSPLYKMSVNRLVYLFVQHVEDVQRSILESCLKSFDAQRQTKLAAAKPPKPSSSFGKHKRPPFPRDRNSHQSSCPPSHSRSPSHLDYDEDDPTNNDRENMLRPDDFRSLHDFQKKGASIPEQRPLSKSNSQNPKQSASSQQNKKTSKSALFESDNTSVRVSRKYDLTQNTGDDNEVDVRQSNRDCSKLSSKHNARRVPSQPPTLTPSTVDLVHRTMICSENSSEQKQEPCPTKQPTVQNCDHDIAISNESINDFLSSQDDEENWSYTVRPKMPMPPFDRILVSDYTGLTPVINESDDDTSTEEGRKHRNRCPTIQRYLQENGCMENSIELVNGVRTGESSSNSSADVGLKEVGVSSQTQAFDPSVTTVRDVPLLQGRALCTSKIENEDRDNVKAMKSGKESSVEVGNEGEPIVTKTCSSELEGTTDPKFEAEENGLSPSESAKTRLMISKHEHSRTVHGSNGKSSCQLTRDPDIAPDLHETLILKDELLEKRCAPLLCSTPIPSLNLNQDLEPVTKPVAKSLLTTHAQFQSARERECVPDCTGKTATLPASPHNSNFTTVPDSDCSRIHSSEPCHTSEHVLPLAPVPLSLGKHVGLPMPAHDIASSSEAAVAHDVVVQSNTTLGPKSVTDHPVVPDVPAPAIAPDSTAIPDPKIVHGSGNEQVIRVVRDPEFELDSDITQIPGVERDPEAFQDLQHPDVAQNLEVLCGPGIVRDPEVVRDPGIVSDPGTICNSEVNRDSEVVRSLKSDPMSDVICSSGVLPLPDMELSPENAKQSEIALSVTKVTPSAGTPVSAVASMPIAEFKPKVMSTCGVKCVPMSGPMTESENSTERLVEQSCTDCHNVQVSMDRKYMAGGESTLSPESDSNLLSHSLIEVRNTLAKTDRAALVSVSSFEVEPLPGASAFEKEKSCAPSMSDLDAKSTPSPKSQPSVSHCVTGTCVDFDDLPATRPKPAHTPTQSDTFASELIKCEEKQVQIFSGANPGWEYESEPQDGSTCGGLQEQESVPFAGVNASVTRVRNWRISSSPIDVSKYEHKVRNRLMRDCLVPPTVGNVSMSFFPIGDVTQSLSTEEFIKQAKGVVVGAPGVLVEDENGLTYFQGASRPDLTSDPLSKSRHQVREQASGKRRRSPSPPHRNVALKVTPTSQTETVRSVDSDMRDMSTNGANHNLRFENGMCTNVHPIEREAPVSSIDAVDFVPTRKCGNTEVLENKHPEERLRYGKAVDECRDQHRATPCTATINSFKSGNGDLGLEACVDQSGRTANSEQFGAKFSDAKTPGHRDAVLQVESRHVNESPGAFNIVGHENGMGCTTSNLVGFEDEEPKTSGDLQIPPRKTSGKTPKVEERQVNCEEIDVTKNAVVGISDVETVCATEYGPFPWTNVQFGNNFGFWDNGSGHNIRGLNELSVNASPSFRGGQNGFGNVEFDYNTYLNEYGGFQASGSVIMSPGLPRRQMLENTRADSVDDYFISRPLGTDGSGGSEEPHTSLFERLANHSGAWRGRLGRLYSEASQNPILDPENYEQYSTSG